VADFYLDLGTPSARDRAVTDFAEEQWGIIDLGELRALGIGKSGASRRQRAGRLHRIHLGVYSVVPPRLLRSEGRWLAAVKAAGPGAALCLMHAAANWNLRSAPSGPVHVVVASRNGRRPRPGLIIHRCSTLSPHDIVVHRKIRCTTPARTLGDVKPQVASATFDAMLRRAEQQDLDTGGIWGVTDLNTTRIERLLIAICAQHDLPRPRTQQVIGPYTVDFLWPEARLIVETDDFQTHGTRSGFEADRARDAWLATQGFRVVRFTWRQLQDDPAGVAATLCRLLRIAA
jgi:very-short-patch-repair endonuclease